MLKQKIYYLSEYIDYKNKNSRDNRYYKNKKSNYSKSKTEYENNKDLMNDRIYRNCYLYVTDGIEIKEGQSYYNIDEINIIEKLCKKLYNYFWNDEKIMRIGIFSPYESQINMLRKKFDDITFFKIKVRNYNYINKYEKYDIIFISLVRTSYEEILSINNIEKIKRILNYSNYLKFIIGNIDFISSNNHLRDLYNYLNNKNYVHEYNDNG
jgi:hypothetical protein